MKRERIIEILAEVNITPKTKHHSYDYLYKNTLTAMQRAVEEVERDIMSKLPSWNQLQSDITRLRECEAIVRELADVKSLEALDAIQDTARQWVKNNPK